MLSCCVPFCENTTGSVSKSDGISFHKFPGEEEGELRAMWRRALGQPGPVPEHAVVCSQHFLHEELCGKKLLAGAVPTIVQVCWICLDTDTKMFSFAKHNLQEVYQQLTGYSLCDEGNLKQTLCVECTQRLMNFSKFRDKSLTARSLMMDLIQKHELILKQHIDQLGKARSSLKSSLTKCSLSNTSDLHIVSEIKSELDLGADTQPQTNPYMSSGASVVDQSVVKSEPFDPELEMTWDCEGSITDTKEDGLSNSGYIEWTLTPHELKCEEVTLQCTQCSEEFTNEIDYSQHNCGDMAGSRLLSGCSTGVAATSVGVRGDAKNEVLGIDGRHMITHTGEKPYSCELCDYKTGQKRHLKAHLRTHTGEKPYSCELCDYKSRDKGTLMKHMRTHTGEKPYSCELCDYKTGQKGHLKAHLRTHTGEKPYSCELCDYKSGDNGSLMKHMRTHTGEKPYSCELCDYKAGYKISLMGHMRTHTGENLFSCAVCDYKAGRKADLTIHLRTHTGEKPFSCTLCDYKAAHKGTLMKHMRTHTGEKPYSCELCDYKFGVKETLKTHMRTHTGEKLFSCTLCDYKAGKKADLTTHLRTHTGEKPFSCTLCDYKAGRKDSIMKHMRTHTGEKPYSCELCDYKAGQKETLKTHMRTHTGEKPYSCELCDYKTVRKGYLMKHMRTHTGEKHFS